MSETHDEIINYYVSEFERYTRGIKDGTLSPGAVIDRLDPGCRVMLSDLSARFPRVDWIEAMPAIARAITILKQRKLWS